VTPRDALPANHLPIARSSKLGLPGFGELALGERRDRPHLNKGFDEWATSSATDVHAGA